MNGATEMAVVDSIQPLLSVVLPAVLAILLYRYPSQRYRDVIASLGVVATLILLLSMVPALLDDRVHLFEPGELAPNINLTLEGDLFGLLFAVSVASVLLITSVYSIWLVPERPSDTTSYYQVCILAALSAGVGAGLAGNLLLLFIFLEVLTLVTYPLIAGGGGRRARRAGYTYLAYALGAGLLVLIGIRMVYAEVGTLAFTDDGIAELWSIAATEPLALQLAFTLLVLGFGAKAGFVPIHSWLIRARRTETPIFGAVLAVVVTTAGMFGIVRIYLHIFGSTGADILGMDPFLLAFAALTVVTGGLMAVGLEHLLDRLTYLTMVGSAVTVPLLLATVPDTSSVVLLYMLVHGVWLLLGFLILHLVEIGHTDVSDDAFDRRPIGLGIVAVGIVTIAGLFGILAGWYLLVDPIPDHRLLISTVIVINVLVHALALWPATIRLRKPTAVDIDCYPATTGWTVLDAPVNSCRSMFELLATTGERLGRVSMQSVRDPANAIETTLPDRLVPRYHHHRQRTLGLTGTKLGIVESIYVLVLVLILVLLLGLW